MRTIGRVTAVGGRSSPPSPFGGREYASRWEGPLRGEKQPEAPRPGTLLYPRARRMRDTDDDHSRSAAGMSLPTSTHSDTTKSRYWVTTTRSPVVETTPPTQAPSGRDVRCRSSTQSGNRFPSKPWQLRPSMSPPCALPDDPPGHRPPVTRSAATPHRGSRRAPSLGGSARLVSGRRARRLPRPCSGEVP